MSINRLELPPQFSSAADWSTTAARDTRTGGAGEFLGQAPVRSNDIDVISFRPDDSNIDVSGALACSPPTSPPPLPRRPKGLTLYYPPPPRTAERYGMNEGTSDHRLAPAQINQINEYCPWHDFDGTGGLAKENTRRHSSASTPMSEISMPSPVSPGTSYFSDSTSSSEPPSSSSSSVESLSTFDPSGDAACSESSTSSYMHRHIFRVSCRPFYEHLPWTQLLRSPRPLQPYMLDQCACQPSAMNSASAPDPNHQSSSCSLTWLAEQIAHLHHAESHTPAMEGPDADDDAQPSVESLDALFTSTDRSASHVNGLGLDLGLRTE